MCTSAQRSGFADLGVIPSFCQYLHHIGWIHPTRIQQLAIPNSIQGKDVIGLAETGSGKTGAFLIPVIQSWILAGRPTGFGLILVPTRELAQQLTDVATILGANMQHGAESIVILQLIGGESLVEQALRLAWHRHHLLIATPGRLVEHLLQSRDSVRQQMSTLRHLVIDEADRMLNMAFADDLDIILGLFESGKRRKVLKARLLSGAIATTSQNELNEQVNPSKTHASKYPHPQTYLYSATMTKDVLHLKRLALSPNAVIVNASKDCVPCDSSKAATPSLSSGWNLNDSSARISLPDSLLHFYIPLRLADKPAVLLWLLQSSIFSQVRDLCSAVFKTPIDHSQQKAIVFCRRCQEAVMVSQFLNETGYQLSIPLTGRIPQLERQKNLSMFLSGNAAVLVATDVASRGLDFPSVGLVINYSVPLSEELYRHRVGRTARSGKPGVALTLVTRDCASQFLELESTLSPHLPVHHGEQTIRRWPIAVPNSSGMLALRRQAETAWRKAAKTIRMHQTATRNRSLDGEEDSETSVSSLSNTDISDTDTDKDAQQTAEATDPLIAERNTSFDFSGAVGLRAVKEAKKSRAKRRHSSRPHQESRRHHPGWSAHNTDIIAESIGSAEDEQDNLHFTESLLKKYPQRTTATKRKGFFLR